MCMATKWKIERKQLPTLAVIYNMKKNLFVAALFATLSLCNTVDTTACTGISLQAADGSYIMARTIEWSGSKLPSEYIVVPRGTKYTSYTPTGKDGLVFECRYGMVGVALVESDFIAEVINEVGLSAGLFYFPNYGEYPPYDESKKRQTLADLQVVPWLLSQFATVDEVKANFSQVRVTLIAGSSTVHWRIADASGKQAVIEIIDGEAHIYDNTVGVLANSPSFPWQVTNLNNYVNLYAGGAPSREEGEHELRPFGAGSGMLGLPGDMTPPSRFVRAFFYRTTAPQLASGEETVLQCFQILNNFDLPIGTVVADAANSELTTATQWTAVTDITNRKFYYRTMQNSAIRCIDLSTIDFATAKLYKQTLDVVTQTPIELVPTR